MLEVPGGVGGVEYAQDALFLWMKMSKNKQDIIFKNNITDLRKGLATDTIQAQETN